MDIECIKLNKYNADHSFTASMLKTRRNDIMLEMLRFKWNVQVSKEWSIHILSLIICWLLYKCCFCINLKKMQHRLITSKKKLCFYFHGIICIKRCKIDNWGVLSYPVIYLCSLYLRIILQKTSNYTALYLPVEDLRPLKRCLYQSHPLWGTPH